MQKMAKYHIDTLKIFPGFFIPHLSKKQKMQVKNMKKDNVKKKKFKVNVAILGGGDVIFPIIAAGVVMKTWGFYPALFVTGGATLGLTYLFFSASFISSNFTLGSLACADFFPTLAH